MNEQALGLSFQLLSAGSHLVPTPFEEQWLKHLIWGKCKPKNAWLYPGSSRDAACCAGGEALAWEWVQHMSHGRRGWGSDGSSWKLSFSSSGETCLPSRKTLLLTIFSAFCFYFPRSHADDLWAGLIHDPGNESKLSIYGLTLVLETYQLILCSNLNQNHLQPWFILLHFKVTNAELLLCLACPAFLPCVAAVPKSRGMRWEASPGTFPPTPFECCHSN